MSPSLSPWSSALRSVTGWFESQTGAVREGGERGRAPGRTRPSGPAGVPRGAAPLEDARRTLASRGARRASSCSALDSGYPARPEVASLAAPEPHDGRPGRDHCASKQPCPRPRGSLPRPCPGLAPPVPRGPRGAAATHSPPNSEEPPELFHLPGPLPRAASGYSPPKARGAAASLGSWPGSLNLLFSSEPPERLAVEICCNVAYHLGFAGACCSAFCPAPRAQCRAPPPLDARPGERPVEL